MILLQCTENTFCCFGLDVYVVMQILVAAFLAILFIQSGLDKISDRKGNLEFMSTHFSKSPLKNSVPFLLSVLTLMELGAGILNLSAIISLFFNCCGYLFFWASVLSAINFLSLFFAQRVAKDYAGAQGLTGYFIISLMGIWLCS